LQIGRSGGKCAAKPLPGSKRSGQPNFVRGINRKRKPLPSSLHQLFYTPAKSVGGTAVHRLDSSPTNDVISEIRRVDGIVQRETRFSTEVFLLLALAFGKIYQWFFEPRTLLLTISNVNLRRCCSPWSDEGA